VIVPRGVVLLGILAVVSIALNLFLAGGLLGRQFHRPSPGREFETRLEAVLRDVPEPDHKLAQDILQENHDVLLEKWHAARNAGQRAALSMRATPFDANEAKADIAKWNERIMDFRTTFQQTMMEIAGKMSPEGRARLRLGPGQ